MRRTSAEEQVEEDDKVKNMSVEALRAINPKLADAMLELMRKAERRFEEKLAEKDETIQKYKVQTEEYEVCMNAYKCDNNGVL